MTAPDPRVGEIQARLGAADLGKLDYGLDESGNGYHLFPHDSDSAIAFVHDAYNAALFAAAPADIAYLLAELADRDEKLARVEDVLAKKYMLWAAICGNTCSKDILGVDHDAIADEIAAAIRAAIAAAGGGGK